MTDTGPCGCPRFLVREAHYDSDGNMVPAEDRVAHVIGKCTGVVRDDIDSDGHRVVEMSDTLRQGLLGLRPRDVMCNAAYTAKADFLVLLATVLADAASQAEDCLRTIGQVHVAGPFVDPTAYRNGLTNLREQEELFRPLLACAKQIGPIIERHRAAAKVPR